jgi:hypothetical protein
MVVQEGIAAARSPLRPPAEYKAGLDLAIARGWLVLHGSGTYLKFTQEGANFFA